MSNLSGLPPAAIAAAAAKAQIQDVVVRLILMPDSLKNNPQPLILSGTIKGQTLEGYVQVETDRGIINILLKDKGNLPVGQKIEIEIPAGRPPQQAAIRPEQQQATPPPVQTTPHLQIPKDTHLNLAAALTANAGVKLDRPQSVKPDDIAEALLSAKPGEDLRLTAPLQVGQILRLVPISSMPQTLGNVSNLAVFSPEELFTSLMKMIGEAVDLPLQIRQNLTQLLSRIDLSGFLPASGEDKTTNRQAVIASAFQSLVQDLDLPQTLKLQNASLQNRATPFSAPALPNSTRPFDVQILAFQSGNFQAALTQTATSGIPVLLPDDFVTLPQPPVSGQATAITLPPISGQPASPPSQPVTTPVPQNQAQPSPAQTPATQTGSQPPPPQQPPALLGQVMGFTAQGQPIISLALPGSPQPVNYAVQFVANNIIEGAPVIVSPLPAKPQVPQAGIVPFAIGMNQPLAEWAQSETWDTLQTLIGTIAHINPAAAQAMTQMLPNTAQPQNMGALSLFFLAVMRSGDLDTWIGTPTVNLLKTNSKIDVLRALAGETAVTGRLENTPLPNDWRATIFPFWHGNEVYKLPVFFKNWNDDNENDNGNENKKKMRFMFELKLSRMGPVQVDGFMQKEKLDMILRTKSTISLPMQEALRKTYHNSMERSNLSGEITFQFKPEQWVHVDLPT